MPISSHPIIETLSTYRVSKTTSELLSDDEEEEENEDEDDWELAVQERRAEMPSLMEMEAEGRFWFEDEDDIEESWSADV